MKIFKNNNSKEKVNEYPTITRHFAERYYERIFSSSIPKNFGKSFYHKIREDMENRMLDREKEVMTLFSNSTGARLPLARYNSVVVKKNTLITVY